MEKDYVYFNKFEKPIEDTYNTAALELTNYCNLNCVFCFNSSSSINKDYMTFDQFKIIVDKLKKDVYYIQLSGGEPLANPYIHKMIDYLSEIKLRFHINTNGMLMDDEMFSKLSSCDLASIQFSLDGAYQQTDDYIRGKGHFNTITSLLKRFSDNQFNRGLTRMVITSKNYNEIEDYFNLNLKYGFIPTFSFLVRSGRAGVNWNEIRIDDEKIYVLRELIQGLFDKNKDYFTRFNNPHIVERFKNLNLDCVGECQFSLDHYTFLPNITVNGNVYPCESLFQDRFIIGNILSEDPKSIFSSSNPKVIEISKICKRRKHILDTEVCRGCEINDKCGKGCVAKSIFSGDIFGVPDDCNIRKKDYEKSIRNSKRIFLSQLLAMEE